MNVEGKLHLKHVTADDFGKMRSSFVAIKKVVDELYGMAEMSMSRNQIKYLVQDVYKLGKLVDAYEIFGGYVNRSFGAIVEKDGVHTDYFVRKYKKTVTDHDIEVEHSLVDYAIEKGIDVAAGVIRQPDGKTYAKIEEEKEGKKVIRSFAIYDFLDGEDTYDWLNTSLKPEEDINFGELQAKFHNYTNGFDPGEKEEPKIYDFLEVLKTRFTTIFQGLGIPENDRYLKLWKESLDEIVHNCGVARQGLEQHDFLAKAPITPCHCDYHPGNVKWRDGKCVGLFDFDWSKLDHRLFDVCFGLVYTVSSWDPQNDGEIYFDRLKYYLQGYNHFLKEKGTLTPFTPEECECFPAMMLAATIYLLNWSNDYLADWENLNEYEYFYYLAHILKVMRFILAHPEELKEAIKSV